MSSVSQQKDPDQEVRSRKPSVWRAMSGVSRELQNLVGVASNDDDDDNDVMDMACDDFAPDNMRCLALVAHNHMKSAMKDFVVQHKHILRRFRLTGTATTMRMLGEVFGDDPGVQFGPTCTSGPLGGDAQVAAQMVFEGIGGLIFFEDPLSAHPHEADIQSLCRLANVHNVVMATNPTTAILLMNAIDLALEKERKDFIPSFFCTLESPSVKEYKAAQIRVVEELRTKPTPEIEENTPLCNTRGSFRSQMMESYLSQRGGFNVARRFAGGIDEREGEDDV